MYCKTYILLERDFRELRQNNFVGISASPVSDDMLKWEAEIEGLQDSMWQGLHFQLVLTFPSEYNHVPPVVKFTSIPFHPNVDPNTGRPSIDFLDNPARWNPSYTLSSILLALQVMLSNPMLENPVNLEASQTLVKNEYLYRNIIHTLSQEPGQVEDKSQESSTKSYTLRNKEPDTFSDYYKAWSEIATSKTTEQYRNSLFEDPNFIGKYYRWRKMDLQCYKEWKLKFATTKCRLARENRMRHEVNYRAESISACPSLSSTSESASAIKSFEAGEQETEDDLEDFDETWEEEVQNLVDWSAALDAGSLD
ncbi:ubiquitin-conjugating enzyme E2 U isoform X1 [Dipodomys merriami]|uniref:ubiquitin-conjugating enzyme E2 U isoform X1 n=2 Tax=Dipodomys merriami TaxID=94247 RepID=UPI003855B434